MENFNKYQFIENLTAEITAEIEKGNISSYYEIQEYIDAEIDTACIYYSDCFAICFALNATDFDDPAYAGARNITELAYYALADFVQGTLEFSELIKLAEAN